MAIVNALRGASLEELMAITGGASRSASRGESPKRDGGTPKNTGRLERRSHDDIATIMAQIVRLVARHPDGLRAEQIKAALGLEKTELPKPLLEGLASGVLTKTGQKRATTYFARAGEPSKKTAASRRGATKK
jgi:hypothetical protein